MRQPAAGQIFVAGEPGELLEKPGKMIAAEACEPGKLIDLKRLRAVIIDVTADAHEFLDIFLLLAGRKFGEFSGFRYHSPSQNDKKTQQQRPDRSLPERIIARIFPQDIVKQPGEGSGRIRFVRTADQQAGPQGVKQEVHAVQPGKQRIIELQDQPLSIRRRKERVKFSRRNEQNISRVKSDGFAVCFHGIFIFDRTNDFKRGVPVERKILRVPVDKGAHAGHAPVGDRFMRAVQNLDQTNHLRYCQFFLFSV